MPDGSSITGPSYEYIVTGGASCTLSYTAANAADKATREAHAPRAPQRHAADRSAFGTSAAPRPSRAGTTTRRRHGLVSAAGTPVNFVNNDIYEFSYTAKDPTLNGPRLRRGARLESVAALRRRDDFGNANPLAGDIKRIYTEISSQPGRLLNDFRHLGFNEAEDGKQGVRRPSCSGSRRATAST